ncbi:MAG: fluoride efflux transporter CrcB [Planctomycetales bacterium]
MYQLFVIAAGGSVGAVLRYLIVEGVKRLSGEAFPLGTLTVNVIGCFLFGLAFAFVESTSIIRHEHRLALLVGFLGAFTTFSAFGADVVELSNNRQFARAALYIVLSNALGIAAVWLGIRIINRFVITT